MILDAKESILNMNKIGYTFLMGDTNFKVDRSKEEFLKIYNENPYCFQNF